MMAAVMEEFMQTALNLPDIRVVEVSRDLGVYEVIVVNITRRA